MIPLLTRYRLWRAAWRMARREHAVSRGEPAKRSDFMRENIPADTDLVTGLKREASEQHGPRPTAYTRKLGAVK